MSRPPTPIDPFRLGPASASPLARRIAERIERDGPIGFAEFMTVALHDPAGGYYRSGRATVGREGDFLTSPELHPVFGYAVASLAAADWESRGTPERYTLCDVGPGTGALVEAASLWIDAQRPDFAAAFRAILVEPDPVVAGRQRTRLGSDPRLTWCTGLDELEPVLGLVVANELLDAQPVRRLRWNSDGWHELCVGLDGDRFVEVCASLAEGPAGGLAELHPVPGQVVEVCPGLAALIEDLAAALNEGLLLCFDYGDHRARLYAPWRRDGTLMTFRRHVPGSDPLVHVGEQDITCHVDVDAVQEAASQAGLAAYPLRSQAEWLAAIGATNIAAISDAGLGAHLDAHLEQRRAAQLLIDPGGLGRIQVMAFAKGPVHPLLGIGDPELSV